MRVEVRTPDAAAPRADVLAVPLADGDGDLPAAARSLGDGLASRLRQLAAEEEVASEIGRTAVLVPDDGADVRRLVAVGLGPLDELDSDSLRTAAASVAEATERIGGTLVWPLDDALPFSSAEQARAVVDGLLLGTYDPGRWKAGAKNAPHFDQLVLLGPPEVAETAEREARIAEAANRARDLANMGGNELTPERLAARAEEIAAEQGHVRA
jgi:leucyl aminopeptidase